MHIFLRATKHQQQKQCMLQHQKHASISAPCPMAWFLLMAWRLLVSCTMCALMTVCVVESSSSLKTNTGAGESICTSPSQQKNAVDKRRSANKIKHMLISCCVGVGNTCHLNSTLQMLNHAHFIRTWVTTRAHTHVPHNSPCVTALQHLFANMSTTTLGSSVLSTKPLLQALRRDGQSPTDHWSPAQKDASETLGILMHLTMAALGPLHQLFVGEEQSTVIGNECQHASSSRIEPFTQLQIELTARTLEGCLQAHYATENLTNDNKWYCEACGCKVCATKTISATKLPGCLFVQLKRFQYDVKSMQAKKLNKKVRCRAAKH